MCIQAIVYRSGLCLTFAIALIIQGDVARSTNTAADQATPAIRYSAMPERPAAISWTDPVVNETKIAQIVKSAYDNGVRWLRIDGQWLRLRIPFGMNGERSAASGQAQNFLGDGKASPDRLWPAIIDSLHSSDAVDFRAALNQPGPKTIRFDLVAKTWKVEDSFPTTDVSQPSGDPEDSPLLQARLIKTGPGVTAADMYDYLYSIAALGMDCSGFVYYIQKSIAQALAVDLDILLAAELGVRSDQVSGLAGIQLFDPANGHTEGVFDTISALRPGDILLFRGQKGIFKHSAVIQSINWQAGIVQYVQSTDWAPREQRGVHDSYIHFDPARPDTSLADPSVRWLQKIQPAFPGETEPRGWLDDGDRYRNRWSNTGRGIVVRLNVLRDSIEARNPDYYLWLGPGIREVP